MKFLSLLKLTQNKHDYFKYFVIFLFLIVILNNFPNLFSYRFLLTFIISIVLVLAYIKYNSDYIMDDYKIFKQRLTEIDAGNLGFLNNDFKILSIYTDLIDLKKINESAFNNSLRNINQFLKLYLYAHNNNKIQSNIYEAALYRRDLAINELMSIIVNSQSIYSIVNDVKGDKIRPKINENILKEQIKKLRDITGKYIVKISEKINYFWNNRKSYIYSKPIYIDKIKSNPYTDKLFSNKFNIY